MSCKQNQSWSDRAAIASSVGLGPELQYLLTVKEDLG